jgi:hypothetical protein
MNGLLFGPLIFAAAAQCGTIAPFTLDFSQVGGPSAASGITLASGLNFPYELSVSPNGSLLFGQTISDAASGLTYGWGLDTAGTAWMLPGQGNGAFGPPVAVSSSFSGIAVSVKSLSDGVLVIDSGAAGGGSPGGTGDRTMNFVSPAGQTIGTLNFAYPSGCAYECWEHGNGMSLAVPGTNGSNTIYFIVGSELDDSATIPAVSVSGMGLSNVSLNADSIYMMTVQSTSGNSVVITSGPQQVATGLRNPFALNLDSAGDLVIADNGIDGGHAVHELGADTIDEIPVNAIGQQIYDFGFPDSYTDYGTGQRVNGDPNAVPPVVSIIPSLDSGGIPQNCEGASASVFLAAGSLAFVGIEGGEVVSCDGNSGAAGITNTDNSVVYYDFASGQLIPILNGGNPEVGHIDGLASIGSDLFLLDSAASGSLDDLTGAGQGAIYEFDLASSAPEPGTWALGFAGIAFSILRWRRVRTPS